jgi:hypothetical protein
MVIAEFIMIEKICGRTSDRLARKQEGIENGYCTFDGSNVQ